MEDSKEIKHSRGHKAKLLHFDDTMCSSYKTEISRALEELLRELQWDSLHPDRFPSQYEIINLLSQSNLDDGLQELSELATDPDDFLSDIPLLKKRIKYCKNPLERKNLERQLNAVYKKMKKRR